MTRLGVIRGLRRAFLHLSLTARFARSFTSIFSVPIRHLARDRSLMLTWLSCGAAATAPAPEGTALASASSSLLAAGEASACSSVTADDNLSTRCATGCQAGYCLVPGGWKCTCTASTSSPPAALLPVDEVTESLMSRMMSRSASPLTPACAALAEIDPERTMNQTALVTGGWDLARRHPRLVVSFLGCALETARTPAASEMPSSRAERQLEKDAELVSCPLNTPGQVAPQLTLPLTLALHLVV